MSGGLVLDRAGIEAFVFHEAALLDERRLEEWAALFADDGCYWVPARRGGGDPSREVSIVYDTRASMGTRLRWLGSGRAYAQDPPSVTLHQTTNLRLAVVTSEDGEDLVEVRCTNVVWETRPNTATVSVPTAARYLLRPVVGGDGAATWLIVLKYVELLDYRAHYENLTFLL